jgi:hypothetical protein
MRQSMQFLMLQHVSGTNMPIIRSTISEYLLFLGSHIWKADWDVLHWASYSVLQGAQRYTTQAVFQVWPPKSGRYSLIVLLMMGILVPETCRSQKNCILCHI